MLLARTGTLALPPPLSSKQRASSIVASARRSASSSFFDDDPFSFSNLDREVADLKARVEAELPPAPVRSFSSEREQATSERILPGGKGFARTRSSSGRTANSSWSSSESVVVWGVEPPRYSSPAPAPNTTPIFFFSPLDKVGAVALLLYLAVAARFSRATLEGRTKYKTASRWKLGLLWPVLALFSPEFKEELGEALSLEKEKEKEKQLQQQQEEVAEGEGE